MPLPLAAADTSTRALPDLAGPPEFSNAAGPPAFPDPMAVEGRTDSEARRVALVAQVEAAARRSGRRLAEDWSNIWQLTDAVDVLFDLGAIWQHTWSGGECEQYCKEWFLRLLSPEAEQWGLVDVASVQANVPSSALWSRPLKDIFCFLGKAFSLSGHAVAQCFEDNHLSLVRNCFRLCQNGGEVKFPVARWSLLVASSGGGKSPLLTLVENVLKSPRVASSFENARNLWVKPLGKYSWYSAQGSNLEGMLAHASKDNVPIGLRKIHEEVADTIGAIGSGDTDKLRVTQVIRVANPSLAAGKLLKGSAVEVPNLKVCLTAAVQGNLCWKFLPFTPEGESARWVPVVSSPTLGLDLRRSDKLSSKTASTDVLAHLLSAHVLKILDFMTPDGALQLDDTAIHIADMLEAGAKGALASFRQRVGEDAAVNNPVYSFLFGKLDQQFMHHLAAAWFTGESLLCWLNPLYAPAFRTNRVYARIALKRTLVGEADRRVVMLTNRRHIEATPMLRQLCSAGCDGEKMWEAASKRSRCANPSEPV